jgi:hypothetical protein
MYANIVKVILERTNSYLQTFYEEMHSFYGENFHFPLEEKDILFVMDDDIDYGIDETGHFGREPTVSSLKLFLPLEVESVIKPTVFSGPDWIQVNLFLTKDNRFLITLRFGQSVGNPRPSINVGAERQRVKIIE